MLKQLKFSACVQRILEAFGIALPIALAGNDILRSDYAALSLGCASRLDYN